MHQKKDPDAIYCVNGLKKAMIFNESVKEIIEFRLNYIFFTTDKSMRRECQTKLTLLTHFETPNYNLSLPVLNQLI